MQIQDPRWRCYARLQRALSGRSSSNDEATGIERALDALLRDIPREGETHDEMGTRVRASAKRRERRRRCLTAAVDGRIRDEARARATGEPEAVMHARLALASILARASASDRCLVLGLALGGPAADVSASASRKRLQRFRASLRVG